MIRRALIWGITGQDGAYLAKLLLSRGYEVHGTSRQGESNRRNLERLAVSGFHLHKVDPGNAAAVADLIAASAPHEIYYLAAQSSVRRSFEQPIETWQSSVVGLLNVMQAARTLPGDVRILNAASGECFGETRPHFPATESTPFAPRSPYGAAKCASHHAVAVEKLGYDRFVCSAFLFNHESPLRPDGFVIGKVVGAIRRIRAGSHEKVELGNVEVVRDWGWAPDYVEAMWRMLQQDTPESLVVASGRSHSLAEVIEALFRAAGLDWREHVQVGAEMLRPAEIMQQHADPSQARDRLNWRTSTDLAALAELLVGGRVGQPAAVD